MAQLTLTVNDSFVPRITAALQYYYPGQMSGVPAGQGARAVLINFLTRLVANYEAMNAAGDISQQIQNVQNQHSQTYQNQQAQTTTDCGANIS